MPKDTTVIDIALQLLASDAAQDWLGDQGINAGYWSDAAADLWRQENPNSETTETFTLEGIRMAMRST